MEREQFTFYQSFEKAISKIKSKAARCEAYDAVVKYALYGLEPDNISDSAAIVFELTKPVLDASKRKAENGKAGGRPKANEKQTESKPKANEKQNEANEKQNENKKENKKEGKKEREKENECYPTREEVRAYAESRNSSVDPDRFFDYFTADPSKPWVDAKGQRVKNWKQKFITWEGREPDNAGRGNHSGAEDSPGAGAEKWGNLYA
jgi:hypothetical protein